MEKKGKWGCVPFVQETRTRDTSLRGKQEKVETEITLKKMCKSGRKEGKMMSWLSKSQEKNDDDLFFANEAQLFVFVYVVKVDFRRDIRPTES